MLPKAWNESTSWRRKACISRRIAGPIVFLKRKREDSGANVRLVDRQQSFGRRSYVGRPTREARAARGRGSRRPSAERAAADGGASERRRGRRGTQPPGRPSAHRRAAAHLGANKFGTVGPGFPGPSCFKAKGSEWSGRNLRPDAFAI